MKGIFVAGTDTDVGKTFISALLIQALKQNSINPYYYKPVASGGSADIDAVQHLGELDNLKSSCPIIFETPCSPHLASEIEKCIIDKDRMKEDCQQVLKSNDYTLIEGAGGVIVPIHRDGFDLYELMKEVDLPVVLVTRTGVGTINHTLLTLEFLKLKNIKVSGIIFNGYQGGRFEDDNIHFIEKRTSLPILGVVPKVQDELTPMKMKQIATEYLNGQMHHIM